MSRTPKVPEDLSTWTPGRLIDACYGLRERRSVIEASAKIIKEEEDRIKDYLIRTMTKDDLKKLAGKSAQCSLTEAIVPVVKDWDAVNKYIEENDAWDLRNKAANAAAFRARWEDGIEIPGVERYKRVNINVRKL